MPKIQIADSETRELPPLPYAELVVLAKEIKDAGGEQQWLIKQGAIRYDENGTQFVTAVYDAKGKITDVPLVRLKEKISQLTRLGSSKI